MNEKPYESINDERFTWLSGKFLKYFTDWKISIAARPGEFTDNARRQTYEGIEITVHSSIELIKYLLSQGVPYVLTERFCQDSLENYFGRQRSMGCRKDNLLVISAIMINTIRTQTFPTNCWKLPERRPPNLLRLMLRLCHVVRAIENKITQNTLKKEEIIFFKKNGYFYSHKFL